MADRHDVQLRTKLLEKIFPSVDTVDNLESDNPNRPLSARQGKVLKELINAGGGGASGLSIEVVESLPATGVKGILYLVPKTSYLKEENTYDEYVWIESSQKYELLGSFSTDLNIEEYVNKFNSVLGEVQEINVATLSDYGINSYVTTGTYRVYGERINSKDGLPILNAANGHTVEGILKVYNSSIAGTGKNTDKVVTQMLSMSNRHGGDGHIWIRTGQGASEDNLTWSTWEKMQGIFEKNTITDITELDTFTTNGIYSCMFTYMHGSIGGIGIDAGDTLLIIVTNGYMASSTGRTPHLTQTIIHSSSSIEITGTANSIITRSAIWDGSQWQFSTYNSTILEDFYGKDANIGVYTSKTSRITIGTDQTKPVRIHSNVHIGVPDNYDNDYDDKSTIIADNVRIGSFVAIGASGLNDNWTEIAESSRLVKDNNGFNIQNIDKGTKLTLADDTNLSVKGGKTSSVEYKQANTMVIDSPSVTLGHGGGAISIGSGINIGDRIIIGDIVNIEGGVSIGKKLDTSKTVSIGTKVYIGGGINIGNRVKIGNDVVIEDSVTLGTSDISKNISIDKGVHIKGPVNITGAFTSASDVTLGNTINIGDRLTIGNDVDIASNVNIDNLVKIVNETNGLKISTEIGNSLTISTSECSICVASPNTAGNLKFNNNSIITCDAPNIQFGNNTGSVNIGGNVNIAEGFCVEKNTPMMGTITFNENNITFQFGSKSATLQLS